MDDSLIEEGQVGIRTPENKGWRKAQQWLRNFKSPKAETPVAVPEAKLPRELFALNSEVDSQAKTEVINPEGVKRGAPEAHLVDADESVVSFTGSLEQLAELVKQAQAQPLKSVDQTPVVASGTYQVAEGQYPTLQRTGIEVIRKNLVAEKAGYYQPTEPNSAQIRMEVVGVFPASNGVYRVFLMYGSRRDYALAEPKSYPENSPTRGEMRDRLGQTQSGQISHLEADLQNPNLKGVRQGVEKSLDDGAIVYKRGSSHYQSSGGYSYPREGQSFLVVEQRNPAPEQKIRGELGVDIAETSISVDNPERLRELFGRMVIPAKALA